MCIPLVSWNRRCRTSMWFPVVLMSLLGGYKKKSSYDGYESLQLVDSSGDFCTGGRSGGGGLTAVTLGSVKTGPSRPDDYSTMDSAGKKTVSTGCRSFVWHASICFVFVFKVCSFTVRIQGCGLNIIWRYPPEACASCHRLFVCCVMTIWSKSLSWCFGSSTNYFDC